MKKTTLKLFLITCCFSNFGMAKKSDSREDLDNKLFDRLEVTEPEKLSRWKKELILEDILNDDSEAVRIMQERFDRMLNCNGATSPKRIVQKSRLVCKGCKASK